MDHTRKLLLLLESDPKAISLPLLGMYVCNIPFKKYPVFVVRIIFPSHNTFLQRFLLCSTCLTVIIHYSFFFKELYNCCLCNLTTKHTYFDYFNL